MNLLLISKSEPLGEAFGKGFGIRASSLANFWGVFPKALILLHVVPGTT